MKTKFNSQICTTREQSKRLLALGLKRETADMIHSFKQTTQIGDWFILPIYHGDNRYCKEVIPAWSLHRLWEMLPKKFWHEDVFVEKYHPIIEYDQVNYMTECGSLLFEYYGKDIWGTMIDSIEWLIKEGYFKKEYLCEK